MNILTIDFHMTIYNIIFVYYRMSRLIYKVSNNKIQLSLILKNRNIGYANSVICWNTLFIDNVYVDEDFRFKNYGTYLMNSTEIICKQYHNVDVMKLVIKHHNYDDDYLKFFFKKIGYNEYDIAYTNYPINSNYTYIPMFKIIC